MTLQIPDEIRDAAQLTEADALVDLACGLFAREKISLFEAGKLARLSRMQMEEALLLRKIPIYRPTVEDVLNDLRNLEEMRAGEQAPLGNSTPQCEE